MKQTLVLIAASFLAVSVAGQPAGQKTRISDVKKIRGFENFHKFSGRGGHEMHRNGKTYSPGTDRLKSASAEMITLDSTIGHYRDEVAGQWVPSFKEEYAYDAAGNLTLFKVYNADTVSNRWIPDDKNEYAYNAGGDLTVYLFSAWDTTTGQWFEQYKEENIYGAGGRLTQYFSYAWDYDSGKWETGLKSEFAYDGSGHMILEYYYYQEDDTSDWVVYAKDSIMYDAAGNSNGYIGSFWDDFEENWMLKDKNERTYDAEGNLTGSVDAFWSAVTGEWAAYYKEEYTYNTEGKLIQYNDYDWDEMDSLWLDYYKEEFIYDANGNVTQFLDYYWDETQWIYESKGAFTYNNSYSGEEIFYPYFYTEISGIYFDHMVTGFEFFYWDAGSGQFMPEEKQTFYYSVGNVTSVAGMKDAEANIFPNPVSDFLTLDISGSEGTIVFELFDMQGRRLLSETMSNGEKLNMQGFNRGIYFYNVTSDGKKLRGKMIKE